MHSLILEGLQYDETALARFIAELDSPLPGQKPSAASEQRQAEEEMALFRQASGAR